VQPACLCVYVFVCVCVCVCATSAAPQAVPEIAHWPMAHGNPQASLLQCVAVCCSECVAVCCNMLQRVAV